jgi:hypothetical protein
MEHDMIDDTNIPDGLSAMSPDGQPIPHPDVQKRDNVPDASDMDGDGDDNPAGDDTLIGHDTWIPVPDGFGDVSFLLSSTTP